MREQSLTLMPVIEEITKIGSYETDIATGTWVGSENFVKIFGLERKPRYTVDEFIALVHPEDVDWVMGYFNECLKKQIDFNCEYRCVRKSGETIYVSSRSKIYYLPDGTPKTILGVKQDITLSRQNEMRLHQLHENNKQKNEVLIMAAHDLKTPISQITGLAALMKPGQDKRLQELLSLQEEICNSAQEIIGEIIEVAQLEDEAYTLKTTLTNINSLIEGIVESFRATAAEKCITLRTIVDPQCVALVNPEKIKRAIANLLSNAIKFSYENCLVELTAGVDAKNVTIKIRDEGTGISPANLPSLFDKFSKTTRRTGTRGEKSTGLGLNIVKKICELHKGKISVESREGVGTTFLIEIPKAMD